MARRAIRLAVRVASLAGILAGLGPVAVARASLPAEPAGATPRAIVQSAAPLPADAQVAGALPASAPVSVTVALAPRDPAGLAAYAAAVSDPGSALYGDDLDVAQFAARFGAGAPAAATVAAALRVSGLTVGAPSANGLSLVASGSAAEVADAFGTSLSHVELADGAGAYTDTAAPTLPAAAAGLVQSVAGLDSLPLELPEGLAARHRAGAATSPKAAAASPDAAVTTGPEPCASAGATGANTAQQIASAYGLNGLWAEGDLGAGTTVALYELEPYTAADAATYQSCYGTSASITNIAVDGGASCGSDTTCGVEDELDIEDVAGLAPDAGIDVYEGPNSGTGAYDTYQAIVEADAAQVVSTSWGTCEANETTNALYAENTLFQEAAAQGQAVFAASGDSGADDCAHGTHAGTVAVDDPASQPYVTGVGGTSLPSAAAPESETVWDNATGAGGGGVSTRWTQPSWQSAQAEAQTAITCGTHVTSCREVPDVSADADPETGYAIVYDGGWTVYGGTSAAAPTWSALAALADSSSYCGSDATQVGFANPVLYALPSADFYDISSGANSFGGVTGYSAGTGYDMASGLGAPNGSRLVPALCGAAPGTTVPPPASTTTPPPVTTPPTVPSPTPTPPSTATTTITTADPTRTGPVAAVVSYVVRGRRRVRVGAEVHLLLPAHDRLGHALHYAATHLPPGLRISRATGTVTGRPRRAGAFRSSITATDSAGNAESVVIRWTVAPREPSRPARGHRSSHPRGK